MDSELFKSARDFGGQLSRETFKRALAGETGRSQTKSTVDGNTDDGDFHEKRISFSDERLKREGAHSTRAQLSGQQSSNGQHNDHNMMLFKRKKDKLGVSIHYLRTSFIEEIKAHGLNIDTATVYDVNDQLVRTKGRNIISPVDGKRGIPYVNCLFGEENVGCANLILSYCHGYSIGMTISTLVDWSLNNKKDLKRTYVWIDILCINQHRIAEKGGLSEASGMLGMPAKEFFDEYSKRLRDIGQMFVMLTTPWSKPFYLKRIWCIYEVYLASRERGVEIIVTMPASKRHEFVYDVMYSDSVKVDRYYEALRRIRIEQAESSIDDDRVKILDMIEKGVGYRNVNHHVGEFFTNWIKRGLITFAKEHETDHYELSHADFCDRIAQIFRRNGDYDAAIHMLRKSLSVYQASLEENHPTTATCYHNIGKVLFEKGDYNGALAEYRLALTVRQSTLGNTHIDTAGLYNDIGRVYVMKGDYDEALNEYNKVLTSQEQELMDEVTENPEIAIAYENIGIAKQKERKFDEAILNLDKALAMRNTSSGADSLEAASVHTNIANILADKGNHDKALSEYQTALTIYEEQLGLDHQETVAVLNSIGDILRKKGDYDGALSHYLKCLQTGCIPLLGTDHPMTANCYTRIGKILHEKGDYQGALVNYEKALSIREATLRNHHVDTATSYSNLGDVLQDLGDFESALTKYRSALPIFLSAYGNDREAAIIYNNIGLALLQGKDDVEGAVIEFTRALGIQESVLGANHIDTAITYNNLGMALDRLGNYSGSLDQYQKALQVQKEVYGEEHQNTASTHGNISVLLRKRGSYEEALVEGRKALDIREKRLGSNHADTALSYNNIATVLLSMNDYEESLIYHHKCLDIRERVLGTKHPETASSYKNIGFVLKMKGDNVGALVEFNRALTIQISILGKDHPKTSSTADDIKSLLEEIQ